MCDFHFKKECDTPKLYPRTACTSKLVSLFPLYLSPSNIPSLKSFFLVWLTAVTAERQTTIFLLPLFCYSAI